MDQERVATWPRQIDFEEEPHLVWPVPEGFQVAPLVVDMGETLFELLLVSGPPHFMNAAVATLGNWCRDRGLCSPRTEWRREQELDPLAYRLTLDGRVYAEAKTEPQAALALGDEEQLAAFLGLPTTDPVFGLPAKWIGLGQVQKAIDRELAVMSVVDLVVYHLLSLAEGHPERFLPLWWTLGRLQRCPEPVVELVRQRFRPEFLNRLLRDLAKNQVFFPDLSPFLDAVLRVDDQVTELELFGELLRAELGPWICSPHLDSNAGLSVIAVEPALENQLKNATKNGDTQIMGHVLTQLHTRWPEPPDPLVFCCSFDHRKMLERLFKREYPQAAVLSWTDVPPDLPVTVLGQLGRDWILKTGSLPSRLFKN